MPIVYVANNPPTNDSGDGQAILVPQNSPIRSIQDLKGKRIAFQKASSAHNFVIQIVERASLTYKDIQPVYLYGGSIELPLLSAPVESGLTPETSPSQLP